MLRRYSQEINCYLCQDFFKVANKLPFWIDGALLLSAIAKICLRQWRHHFSFCRHPKLYFGMWRIMLHVVPTVPLGARHCCDVEPTSVTLIQRRNNAVCPVGV